MSEENPEGASPPGRVQSAVVLMKSESGGALVAGGGASSIDGGGGGSSSGGLDGSSSPGQGKVDLDDYTLLAPAAMAPHYTSGEQGYVHYIYSGAAVRRHSLAPAKPNAPMAAPKMEYVPEGQGRLDFFLMEDAKEAARGEEVPSSPDDPPAVSNNSFMQRTRKEVLVQYRGSFKEGKKHGKGTLTVPGKWKLTCKWQNDVPELSEEGLLQDMEDRTTYAGLLSLISNVEAATTRDGFAGLEWALHVRLLPDSVGEMLYADRRRYCGQWQSGQCHGFGIMMDVNQGTTFIGAFEYELKHGSGTLYKEASGATFCGQWLEGAVNGAGGLHLKGNTFTVQGSGWNPGISECDEVTIIKSRNVNGVWEPLFLNFDNNLATALGEAMDVGGSKTSLTDDQLAAEAKEEENMTPAEKSNRSVMKLMDDLLARNDFAGLLSIFQRCFYFLYGSCGSNKEVGGGPSGYDDEEKDDEHKANLLSWCCSAGGVHRCIHRATRRRPINEATFQRALDDLASFTFSVRLRLQSFVAMHPAIGEFDVGCGVLRLAFDRLHALVAPVLFNLSAVVHHNPNAAHILACRRCEERLKLEDFFTTPTGEMMEAKEEQEEGGGAQPAALTMPELEDAIYEEVLGPVLEMCDFDESEDALPEGESLEGPPVDHVLTPNGVLLRFNGYTHRQSLQNLFYLVRQVVYAAARLCGSKVVPDKFTDPIDHGTSNLELFETAEQQLRFCRMLQFAVLQRISDQLYSQLMYLLAITTAVEPRYPTPCENDDPSAMMSSPTPRNNTDLFCLETLLSAISSSTTIFPSLRDMSFYHKLHQQAQGVSTTGPQHSFVVDEALATKLVNSGRTIDPVLPLVELFNEVRFCLGRGLFQAYIPRGRGFNAEGSQSPPAQKSGNSSKEQLQNEWSFFLSTRAELTSMTTLGDGSPPTLSATGSHDTGGGYGSASFHEEMDKLIDGEYQIEPFVMELLRTVELFLRVSAEGSVESSPESMSTSRRDRSLPTSANASRQPSRQRALSNAQQAARNNKNGTWLHQRDYIYEPPASELNAENPIMYLETPQATLQVKRVQDVLIRLGINVVFYPLYKKALVAQETDNDSFGADSSPDPKATTQTYSGEDLPLVSPTSGASLPTGQVRMSFRPMANNSCPLFVMQKLSSEWAHDLHTVEHLSRSRRRGTS